MPDPISSTVLRARTSLNRVLISTGTVARTAASGPCSLSKATVEWRPQGLPRYMRVPEWDLRFHHDFDVKKDDSVLVTDTTFGTIGTFAVLMIGGKASAPGTRRVLTTARCLDVLDAAGNPVSVIDTTDTVVFAKNGASNRAVLVTAKAYVSQLTLEDVQLLGPDAVGVKYKAIWDTGVHYGSDVTETPDEGDLIYIPWLERREDASGTFNPATPNLTNRGIPIHRPTKESGPVSWFMATFDEAATR